jgi:predicted ATPase
VVIIAGDPGLGKTRLLDEVLGRVRLDGAAVAAVAAVPADREQAHGGLLGLARGGLLDAAGVAAAQPEALAALAAQLPEWADRFGTLARGVEAQPLPRAMSEIVRAVAGEQPVVLAVDGAHCLDPSSVEALMAMARDLEAAPLCLLLTTERQGGGPELDALWSHVGRDVQGVSVRLEPLDGEAMLRLARWALPAYGEADLNRVARRVAADSAGLPLLAVELLHAIAVGLDLGTVTGAWPQPFRTLSQTLPGDLPGAVVAAIRVGFRRLSEPAQRALAAAAVLGERARAERIGRAAGLDGDALNAALDELEWQRWLAADRQGYAFLARIVREVVARDMVSPGQRRRLQEAAGGNA